VAYQESSKVPISKEKRRENLSGAKSLLCANYIAEKFESCSMKYNN